MPSQGLGDVTETVGITFQNIDYLLTISTINEETLCIEIEQKSDASRWRGDFTSRYIEDITAKTGNFKKFPVFVKMLLSAVQQTSDSVFVDLLTYQDLEVLKTRKAGASAPSSTTSTNDGRPAMPPNNKRYLILTYAAEFDRVHYPLPLLYEENPDPARLKEVIRQLRAQLDLVQQQTAAGTKHQHASPAAAAAVNDELRRLQDENATLQQQLRHVQRQATGRGGEVLPDSDMAQQLKMLRKERDLLQSRCEHMEADLERERGLHRRELRRRAKELQEVHDELAHAKEQIRDLRFQIRQLSDELEHSQRRRTSTSSAERIRSTYGRGPPPPSSRPTSGTSRGVGPSTYHHSNHSKYDPSPYSSSLPRATSRGRSTTASREPSRPNSAPASSSLGNRFDPTEYVRQKKERERSRGRSPTSSQGTSPAGSRPTSAERQRGNSTTSSRPSSSERERPRPPLRAGVLERRPGSLEHQRGAGSSAQHAFSSAELLPKSRSGSSGTRPVAANAWGDPQGWTKFPAMSSGRAGGAVVSTSAERSTSPGQALREVKRKLSEYVHSRGAGSASDASTLVAAPVVPEPTKSAIFEDASADIADIDSRLHALQNFLKMAKSSGSASTSMATT